MVSSQTGGVLRMAFDITTGSLTAIVGLVGVLLGAFVGPFMNHRLNNQYGRKDLIFKRKLEYFEKIAETIEQNKRIYHHAIGRIDFLKNSKEVNKVIEELKQNRKNFLIMSSPLYFNTRRFSEKIIDFVRIENEIFNRISELKNVNLNKKHSLIEQLNENLERLNRKSQEIIIEMRKELIR